ncbi:DUF397 domain-containing protein [Streptomyces sp. AC536]|uniref:DUF397 domain-containing protein n=1 Tax=Streptomyces buecherae TaxID=2763006 RepID=UPI00164E8C31|nr:DUF397 domain-containing protein [Streptomyces buecherae]MBC3982575.1 DUF397 domain-containing protein [Streptomyces buecherae]QNJ40077.1 DUF397 domain-containing protein [Streptomyces buecherae]
MTDKWIKSSYSSTNGGECVEWAPNTAAATGTIPVRDSKDPHGPTLAFDTAAWTAFVTGVKNGDFDA